ncbi:PEP-CTERM sorting domain-containing protein [Duganella callida]|uniref:PEP-CTERM sorting domain-containing protein n=1 Tax=Duganella callida TaxID=2561932 RepID=A0A4Y9RV41_9BURK|nr:PEP-CTERM sorting domain-containing protein [Duganella callida]TFW11675.1 PEP-CTERM sorting domain-containing protein [Duganella callida]
MSLISTALIALGFAGAVQATPAAPEKPPVAHAAPATIVLAHCEANDPTPCGINGAPARTAESDPNTLAPAADPKQQANTEPATPVPEPQTFIMLMLGLVVLGFASRRSSSTEKFSD